MAAPAPPAPKPSFDIEAMRNKIRTAFDLLDKDGKGTIVEEYGRGDSGVVCDSLACTLVFAGQPPAGAWHIHECMLQWWGWWAGPV